VDEKQTKSRNLTFWTKKRNSQFWTKFGRKWPTDRGKIVKFFHIHWHYLNAFTVGFEERMPRIIGMWTD